MSCAVGPEPEFLLATMFRNLQLPSPLTAHSTVRTLDDAGNSMAPEPIQLEQAITPPDFKRQKIPLEKGYSQMDWMKLKKTGRDLQGQPLDGVIC
jgi:hypothetical protein